MMTLKRVFGYGIRGDVLIRKDGKLAKVYIVWKSMLQRCYSGDYQKRWPTYIGCTVCDEWLYLASFKMWFDIHYKEGYHLDKDILIPRNKVYSPDRCTFVPLSVNLLLNNHRRGRGFYPQGVTFDKESGRYMAQCNVEGRRKYLGRFGTIQEASNRYRTFKIAHVRKVAQQKHLRGNISQKVRDALYQYKIED